MISAATGEVSFLDGFRIPAHAVISGLFNAFLQSAVRGDPLSVAGWHQYLLGEKESDVGRFAVELVAGEGRVAGVFLSHEHPFYERGTPEDSERRAFHLGILASELLGQSEFAWGQVFCRVDPKENRDWIVVIYSPFAHIALQDAEIVRNLLASRDLADD